MNTVISPSLMCADQLNIADAVQMLSMCGAQVLHIDVMDGEFVPNIMLGTQLIKHLKRSCDISLDIHLMIKHPEKKLEWFDFGKGDTVSVHFESSEDISCAFRSIKARGAAAYLAVNPDTDVSVIKEYADVIDGVLVMTVNPGAAGQPICRGAFDKIRKTRELLDSMGRTDCRVQVDGCVSFEYAPIMRESGADNFVVGTSSVFHPADTVENNYKRLVSLIE